MESTGPAGSSRSYGSNRTCWGGGTGCPPAPLTCATGGECEVGDTGPGGGIVFYDAGSQQIWGRYLEVAPEGWYDGASTDPEMGWCASSTTWSADTITTVVPGGARGAAIGDGWANSINIAKHCPYGAATAARMYRGGSKTDWYLPAQNELEQLYAQRALVSGLGETNRWSSTEVDGSNAWRKFFNASGGNSGSKAFDNVVRPIRAF